MDGAELITRARRFAHEHHKDITFETSSGYRRHQLEHLQEVADLVWASGGTPIQIAAAWLHDTVEDTPVKLEQIEKEFGKEVAELVHGLTDLAEYKDLPTKERKAAQAKRVVNESDGTKRVKIADQTSNTRFISSEPPAKWVLNNNHLQYVNGAKQIADACKGVSPMLDELFAKEYKEAIERIGRMK